MKIIFFFACMILQLSSITLAIEVQCNYNSDHHFYILEKIYRCEVQNNLNIQSPYLTYIDSASGSHKSGYKNEHVYGFQAENKYIEYFPSGLDQIFPYLKLIYIKLGRLKEIHQSDLRPFSKLTHIYLDSNDIEVIEDDLFDYNPGLQAVSFLENKITNVGQRAFNGLNSLSYLWMDDNPCISGEALDDKSKANKIIKDAKSKCVPKEPAVSVVKESVVIVNRIEIIINNFKVFQTCPASASSTYGELLKNAKDSIIAELSSLKTDLISTCSQKSQVKPSVCGRTRTFSSRGITKTACLVEKELSTSKASNYCQENGMSLYRIGDSKTYNQYKELMEDRWGTSGGQQLIGNGYYNGNNDWVMYTNRNLPLFGGFEWGASADSDGNCMFIRWEDEKFYTIRDGCDRACFFMCEYH